MVWPRQYMEGYRSEVLATDDEGEIPETARVLSSYPNPFSRSSEIRFTVAEPGHVELKVFDMWGREVTTLVSAYRTAGEFTVPFDAGDLASGTYMLRLESGDTVETMAIARMR